MTRKTQFQCQGDSPLSLDLPRLSILLVRGVFPGHRHSALVLLVEDVDGLIDMGTIERDIVLRFPGRCKNSVSDSR